MAAVIPLKRQNELNLLPSDRSVTVIVCTRNRPRELDACLAALALQTRADFEVLVVDNGSTPPVADLAARHGARCVHEPRAGLCIARNTGYRHSAGSIVAYLDDDAIPEPAWLETLVGGFSDRSIAAVTGGIRYMRAVGESRAMTGEESCEGHAARPAAVFNRSIGNWFALACLGGVGDGGNMAFRREALLESPGFDERLGRGRLLEGGDEHVLFMSLLAMGRRIAHVPEAVVRHPYPGEPDQVRAIRQRERRTAFAYLLFLWDAFPERRMDLLRHLGGAVSRRVQPSTATTGGAIQLSYAQNLKAAMDGALIYRAARREWAAISAPSYRGLALARQGA